MLNYQKLFFPIGGGDELKQRLYGAFLIAKYFDVKLEVLKSSLKANSKLDSIYSISKDLFKEIEDIVESKFDEENKEFTKLFNEVLDSSNIDRSLVELSIKDGIRSELVEQESKFCDLVIAAAPPAGVTTATFETAVLKSGKPVLMFPREMESFSMDSIIIGWNNSTEVSRAVTSAIEIIKKAQRVHVVSSEEYSNQTILDNLNEYLELHGVKVTFEVVKTTRIPGQALLDNALNGNFDLIIAGAYGHKGLRELMFGGTTRYLLEHSTIPVFTSH
jgi:nucleotide-binding universal stress UspA family protein